MPIPYHECPSFINCSCNICPLDPLVGQRTSLPGEEKCKAYKPTRFKIGSKYPELLPFQGLTSREFNGKKRWEALSTSDKAIITARASKLGKTQNSRQEKAKK